MLPEDYTLIPPPNRDPDGYYSILPRMTTVFPFYIPLLCYNEISWALVNQNAQDFSMRLWISTSPLDGLVDFKNEALNPAYMNRAAMTIKIWDDFVINPDRPYYDPDRRAALPSALTYYLNVQNLQNQPNAYRISFSA